MLSRDLQRILKIRDYCLGIQDTIARFGNSPDGFLLDSDYQQSIAFSILPSASDPQVPMIRTCKKCDRSDFQFSVI